MTSPGHVTALWAEQQVTTLLDGHDDPPPYGSPAWLQLPDSDPRKVAAVVTAAEQWRRDQAEQQRLAHLLEEDPGRWFREITADADAYASGICRRLASMPTNDELAARRRMPPPRPIHASPDWPPIAIPGRPGAYLTYSEAAA